MSIHRLSLLWFQSNQRVDVLSWANGDLEQRHSLNSHTRGVSDVNWHRFDPNLLASCSMDTFIHIWDMRDPRRPSQSLSAVGKCEEPILSLDGSKLLLLIIITICGFSVGSSQVRWNRLSSFLLATAHDGDIKLWDQRKGTAPVVYISAHLAKVSCCSLLFLHLFQLCLFSLYFDLFSSTIMICLVFRFMD